MTGNESPNYSRDYYFAKFKKMTRVASLKQFLGTQKGSSSFARLLRGKYLSLVHTKMECSFFGNLSQRKMLGGADHIGFPESSFFLGFAEMARRVWCLNILVFSLGFGEVGVFQVRKGRRFSEVYIESMVKEDQRENGSGGGGSRNGEAEGKVQVAFTVVPGFKIGRNLVRCQVYLLLSTAGALVIS